MGMGRGWDRPGRAARPATVASWQLLGHPGGSQPAGQGSVLTVGVGALYVHYSDNDTKCVTFLIN